jgi:hypothetical protein
LVSKEALEWVKTGAVNKLRNTQRENSSYARWFTLQLNQKPRFPENLLVGGSMGRWIPSDL